MTDPNYYSDLWHGDGARDWAGHEDDCCPSPTPEEIEAWRRTAERARGGAREEA